MSNLYEIEYQITMRGGKAKVSADSISDAIDAFCSSDESITSVKEPTQETSIKSVIKLGE